MRRIAVINQKGGVGKTTTSANLGAALALQGRRVVLVDMDAQANLSISLGAEIETSTPSAYTVLLGQSTFAAAIRPTAIENLSLVASNIDLSGAELELAGAIGREHLLRDALTQWDAEHRAAHGRPPADYVIFDCPPSLGLLSVNALAAAGEVLITLQTEFLALQGMTKLVGVVQLMRKRVNPELVITGILPCLYDSRLKLAREVLGEIKSYFGAQVFPNPVRTNVKLAEAPSFGKTIFEYAPESNGAHDYRLVAREVMRRESRDADLAGLPEYRGDARTSSPAAADARAESKSAQEEVRATTAPVAATPVATRTSTQPSSTTVPTAPRASTPPAATIAASSESDAKRRAKNDSTPERATVPSPSSAKAAIVTDAPDFTRRAKNDTTLERAPLPSPSSAKAVFVAGESDAKRRKKLDTTTERASVPSPSSAKAAIVTDARDVTRRAKDDSTPERAPLLSPSNSAEEVAASSRRSPKPAQPAERSREQSTADATAKSARAKEDSHAAPAAEKPVEASGERASTRAVRSKARTKDVASNSSDNVAAPRERAARAKGDEKRSLATHTIIPPAAPAKGARSSRDSAPPATAQTSAAQAPHSSRARSANARATLVVRDEQPAAVSNERARGDAIAPPHALADADRNESKRIEKTSVQTAPRSRAAASSRDANTVASEPDASNVTRAPASERARASDDWSRRIVRAEDLPPLPPDAFEILTSYTRDA